MGGERPTTNQGEGRFLLNLLIGLGVVLVVVVAGAANSYPPPLMITEIDLASETR